MYKRQHHVSVREQRTDFDWAEEIKYLVDVMYPDAEKIILVMDNLNTHKPASLYKRYPQFTYSKTCRCQPPQNRICNLLILWLADAFVQKIAASTCLFQNSPILPTLLPLHNLNFMIWYHYIFREFLFSEFSKPHGSHLGFQFLKHNPIWKEMLLTSW